MTNVSSNQAPAVDALRDIKPPIGFPNVWLWVGIAIVALLVLAAIIALILYYKRKRSQVPVVPPIAAHVRAKQKLQDALQLIAQAKPFCITVSDTVRFYLEERFSFRAPERTTEEFLYELQNTNLLLADQKESLGEFLKSCDLVKFARYEPREPELRGIYDSAVRLVEETEPRPLAAQTETENPKMEAPAA